MLDELMEWYEIELISRLRTKGSLLRAMNEYGCDDELYSSYEYTCKRIEYLEECVERGYEV